MGNSAGMSSKDEQFPAGGWIPQPGCAIATRCSNVIPIRVEGHIIDIICVTRQCEYDLTGGHIPYLGCPIPTCCGKACSVGTEGHIENASLMTRQGDEYLPSRHIPHLCSTILWTAGCQALPIWTKSNSEYITRMTHKLHQFSSPRD